LNNVFAVSLQILNYCHLLGTTDESGALSEAMTKKYLGYALDQGLMGNWTAMIPGLIDVRDESYFAIIIPLF